MREHRTHPPLVIRLGMGRSLLARAQAQYVSGLLLPQLEPGQRIECVALESSAEDPALDAALASGQVDLIVRSAGEVLRARGPASAPRVMTVTPPRQDPRDVWIGRAGLPLAALPAGGLVGASTALQQAQLRARHPQVRVVRLGADVAAHLRALTQGGPDAKDAPTGESAALDGILIAPDEVAGAANCLPVCQPLALDEWLPPAGQGGVFVECRADNEALRRPLERIHDPTSAACLAFERALIEALGGAHAAVLGVCAQPRGVVCGQRQAGWIVRVLVARPDGQEVARAALMARHAGVAALQDLLAPLRDALRSRGADSILGQPQPQGQELA